ncbi:hypothetical protein [Acetobacter syzygii]|nr:hypothetical protein [Acetobacter syzygii]
MVLLLPEAGRAGQGTGSNVEETQKHAFSYREDGQGDNPSRV